MRRAKDELLQSLRREATQEELAKYLRTSKGHVIFMESLLAADQTESIEQMPLDSDGNTEADKGIDVISNLEEDVLYDRLEQDVLHEVMASPMISRRERNILKETVIHENPLDKVGKYIGISRQRVHQIQQRAFGRVRKQRVAFMRGLARALIMNGRIETTEARAKELRPYIEKLVTKARANSVAARRLIASRLGNEQEVVRKLFDEIAPKYKDQQGGYTRITKLSTRDSDAAPMAVIEFI